MRCAECPLTLPCWSGTLGVTRARPELCPRCKRFVVAVVLDAGEIDEGVGGSWYALKCEQRPFDRKMQRRWHRQQENEARIKKSFTTITGRYSSSSEPHRIPAAIPDPVDRCSMGIVLGVCVICSGWVTRWNGKYIDLDEEAQAAVEDA